MKLVKFVPNVVICFEKKWWNYVKMATISWKYNIGYGASTKFRPLDSEI